MTKILLCVFFFVFLQYSFVNRFIYNMKSYRFLCALLLIPFIGLSQNFDASTRFEYRINSGNSHYDQASAIILYRSGNKVYKFGEDVDLDKMIPGYSLDRTISDYDADSLIYEVEYPNELYRCAVSISNTGIAWDTVPVSDTTVKYVCHINSNRFEFVVRTGTKYEVSPLSNYGRLGGVLLEYWRNGVKYLQLYSHDATPLPNTYKQSSKSIFNVSSAELSKIKTDHLVQTTRIFDDVQLCWGKPKADITGDIPFDSVFHFAGGTLAMKRVKLPQLPAHYQYFIELHQHSNGDAYDRTGSVFVIPHDKARSFFDGMNQHPDSLPVIMGKDGNKYQGVVRTADYEPIVELMRFFTPFGVGHFNDRVRIEGLNWRNEAYYKQDVTELSDYLSGDVWVGVWIGNYDGGGHKVTLDLKCYPGDTEMGDIQPRYRSVQPLVNTTNVLEMAGQNYGKMFADDGVKVDFDVPKDSKNVRLRIITTGHGGWSGGDEFNPKANTFIIDGKKKYEYTPWRCDCGRYREWNPVSGNAWDGLTSSDYSRSGWCPGTATQPVYFDLGALKKGKHTLKIDIPQGEPVEGGFSHWCVSVVAIVE